MTASIPIFSPMVRVLDASGNPVASGTVEFYDAGTSTPKTVYADADLTIELGTTVSTDAGGYPVTSGNARTLVYTGTSAFKMIVKDSAGATLVTHDNVPGAVVVPDAASSALSETPIVSKTTNYTVVAGDQGKLLNCNCTSGAFAITLLSAVTAGDGFEITIRHVGTANQVTVRSSGTETISHSGKASYSVALKSYGQALCFVSDGANWLVKASSPPRMLDGVPFFTVADRLTATPSSPTAGARYIITGSPTGAWSTLSFTSGQVAEADGNGSWFAYTPADGWTAYVEDENVITQYRDSTWTDLSNVTAPTTSALKVAIWSDEKSTNTSGGTPADDAWTTHTLQTERSNTITGASLSGSQITLPTGKYRIDAQVAMYASAESQIRLYSVTNATVKGASVQVYTANYTSGTGPASILSGAPLVLTAYVDVTAATETFALQYYVTTGGVASGLGRVRNIGSENEVYALVTVLDLTSIQGPAGSQGTQGVDGLDAAYPYQWSTATSGDPGSGKVRGNNATIASITEIGISETDSAGGTMGGVIDTWDSGTSSVKARIKISKEGATQNFHYFYITGAGTDQGSYWTFPVAYTSTSGTISNGDNCAVLVIEKGDKGDTGATGNDGSAGAKGDTGATGPNTGLDFAWSTATSGDPGSGKVLANNATLTSATAINISKTGRNSESLGAVIATWDDSTNTTHYGHLRIFTVADRTEYIEAEVTGLTDNSTYYTVAVTVTAAAGTPSANDVMAVMFERTGNKGSDGDVTAASAFANDNRLVRSDGTGKGVQASGISVSDSDVVSGAKATATGGTTARTLEAHFADHVSVLDFGAVGDGVTDDTAAIQAAATAASGRMLYFPAGTYLVSAATAHGCIALPTAGISIIGAGRHQSVIKMANTTAAAIFTAIDADEVSIESLGFDGQCISRLAWQRSYVFRGCRKIRVKNCWFYRIGDGGGGLVGTTGFGGSDSYGEGTRQTERYEFVDNLVEDCWGTVAVLMKYIGAVDVHIRGNTIKSSSATGISVESEDSTTEYAERVIVSDNIVQDCDYSYSSGATNVSWGISIGERCREVVCTGNIVSGIAGSSISAGISISTSPSQTDAEAVSIVVGNNSIRTVSASSGRGYGILLQAGDASSQRIAISGNSIDDVEDGIGFDVDSSSATLGRVDSVSITGNVITNCGEFGLLSLTLSSSGSLPSRNLSITGNVIHDAASHGMTLFVANSVISGNTIWSCGGIGLSLLAGSDNLSVTGNMAFENGDSGISGSVSDSVFSGNVCMNNGQAGATSYGLYLTGGTNCSVIGNTLSDDQGSPTQDYGFRGPATSRVFHNDIVGNASGSVFGGLSSVNDGTFDLALNRTSTSSGSWLEDPNADRIRFWDDSAGVEAWLSMPAAGLTISGTGIEIANDLSALEALSATGLAARTATDTWAQRTITGTSSEISVANGDGVSGNPTLSLPATVNLSGKTLPGLWRVIANSAVAVPHTGDTSETTLATVTVPAGAMGANGCVRIWVLYSWTNSANNKTPRIRWNGTSGTIVHGFTATTTTGEQAMIIIRNRNSASSQVSQVSAYSGLGNMTASLVTDTVDTTAAVDISIRGILASSGETITLEAYTVEVLYQA